MTNGIIFGNLYLVYSFLFNIFYWFIFNNHLFLIFFFISVLGEGNRVPYDLPEAESELVAGFITEYSSVIFSLILFTEYANIIAVSFWIMILFSLNYDLLMFFLFFICLIRTTLNRLKFDELMTNAWIVILPFQFSLLLLNVVGYYDLKEDYR
jgi:NADH-quinone oxidoreductase subunit H